MSTINSEPRCMFVVVRHNGRYDARTTKPICVLDNQKDADFFARKYNHDAARLDGLARARDLLMDEWSQKFPIHDNRALQLAAHDSMRKEEWQRLTHLLMIGEDAKALGFTNDYEVDNPSWVVVEVPFGVP